MAVHGPSVVVVTPVRAELGPGTGRRPVISQVTLVSFPTNTSTLPFPPPLILGTFGFFLVLLGICCYFFVNLDTSDTFGSICWFWYF